MHWTAIMHPYPQMQRTSLPARNTLYLTLTNLLLKWLCVHMLDRLKPTAAGLDGLPEWFLRVSAPVFAAPLAALLNQSNYEWSCSTAVEDSITTNSLYYLGVLSCCLRAAVQDYCRRRYAEVYCDWVNTCICCFCWAGDVDMEAKKQKLDSDAAAAAAAAVQWWSVTWRLGFSVPASAANVVVFASLRAVGYGDSQRRFCTLLSTGTVLSYSRYLEAWTSASDSELTSLV